MAISELTELFTNVGFPIAIVVVLVFVVYVMGKRIVEQSDKHMAEVQERSKEREERLYTEIKESRAVNEKAVDTIRLYAEKLDNIQTDVREIKRDITTIMTNKGGGNG